LSLLCLPPKKCFGESIETLIYSEPSANPLIYIPLVPRLAIKYLLNNAIQAEGIFRCSGSHGEITRLKESFDNGMTELPETNDVHVVAGLLKMWLRMLPEPLLTFELYPEFIKIGERTGGDKSEDAEAEELRGLIDSRLPLLNRRLLQALLLLAREISRRSHVNRMPPDNLAIVLGPNLLWAPQAEGGPDPSAICHANKVVRVMISNFDKIFPSEEDPTASCEHVLSTANEGDALSSSWQEKASPENHKLEC